MTAPEVPAWARAVCDAVKAIPEVVAVHYQPPVVFLPQVIVTGRPARGLYVRVRDTVHDVEGKPFAWGWLFGFDRPDDPRAVLLWERGE